MTVQLSPVKVTNVSFTLGAEVLEAFVVLQQRFEVTVIGEHLQAIPQHRGSRGEPGNSLFEDEKIVHLRKFKFPNNFSVT